MSNVQWKESENWSPACQGHADRLANKVSYSVTAFLKSGISGQAIIHDLRFKAVFVNKKTLLFPPLLPIFGKKLKLREIKIYKLLFYLKNPFHQIVPLLFTDFSLPFGLPSGLPFGLPMLLPVLFLPVGDEVERREQTWLPDKKLKRGEARRDTIYYYCSITQSDFTNSFFLWLWNSMN